MNILVTGSGGYIGRGTVDRLITMGHTVIDYCRSMQRHVDTEKHKYVYGELYDVPRLVEIIKRNRIERIIHTAAQSSPSISLEVPLQTVHTNIMCTVSLLEAARLCGIKRVVLFCTLLWGQCEL